MFRTLLVTGGLGFIGSHFLRLVLRERPQWRLINVDRLTYAANPDNLADVEGNPRYQFVAGDIADREGMAELFRTYRPEAVVNFAAESHVDRSILDPTPFLRTNVEGVLVLLQAVQAAPGTRLLQVSTDEVYGDIPEDTPPVDEDAPLRPSSPYSATKASADLLALAWVRTYGTPVILARSANNYGPNQFPEKLIPLMIHRAAEGHSLPVYGDGRQCRDWLHVTDNVTGLLRVLEAGTPGRVYNLGTSVEHTNREVVDAICDSVASETGRSPDRLRGLIQSVADRPGHDRRYAMSTSRVQRELGWRPTVALSDGLRDTVRWYLANPQWVDRAVSGEYRRYVQAVYHDRRPNPSV